MKAWGALVLALSLVASPASAAFWSFAGGYGRMVRLGPANSGVGYAAFLPQAAWRLGAGRFEYVVEGHVSRWFGEHAWVAGAVPVGVRFDLGRAKNAPFLSAGLGFAWTDLEPLIEIDRRFNFIVQAGAGIRLPVGGRSAWTAEARFFHLSNANTAGRNLGVNSVAILAGYRP